METPRADTPADLQAVIDGEVTRHLARFQEGNREFLARHLPAVVRQAEAGERRRDNAEALAELDLIA